MKVVIVRDYIKFTDTVSEKNINRKATYEGDVIAEVDVPLYGKDITDEVIEERKAVAKQRCDILVEEHIVTEYEVCV